MATGLRCFLMVVLIAAVEIKRAGCMDIFSSREPVFLQEGEKLSLNCTLSYKNEEAKGLTMFWCKNRITQGCSPGTSLQQLKLKREVGVGEIAPLRKRYTSIVLTILQAKPTDSGIYQCCARSQNPNTLFQSHYIPVTITGEPCDVRGLCPISLASRVSLHSTCNLSTRHSFPNSLTRMAIRVINSWARGSSRKGSKNI
ncbi:CD160 antigen isoform X1 [Trichosurus vulpecula]|uniref:CD160 antigen isoform X1 n=1 Tax=Trichosurus vulpecula TaxID=9337 RepID=UPI00186B3B51|nr:CD160 antigen isoform X1 [Trichosurus vulpecula]